MSEGSPRSLAEIFIFWYTLLMNIKDVERLAELARIELSNGEKKELLPNMESILGYVKQIEKVKEDSDVGRPNFGRPTSEIQINIWREDEITPREFSRELIINQFPDSKDGFLKVKKIL